MCCFVSDATIRFDGPAVEHATCISAYARFANVKRQSMNLFDAAVPAMALANRGLLITRISVEMSCTYIYIYIYIYI